MANILILYESNRRGYTRTMARLVAEGARSLGSMDVKLLSVVEAGNADVIWADSIAVGSHTSLRGISWRMKKWRVDRSLEIWGILDGKLGCVFPSSGSWCRGVKHTCQALSELLMSFAVQVFGVTYYVAPKLTPHYGAICAVEPRTEAEKNMRLRIGCRLAEWCSACAGSKPESHPRYAAYNRPVKNG